MQISGILLKVKSWQETSILCKNLDAKIFGIKT